MSRQQGKKEAAAVAKDIPENVVIISNEIEDMNKTKQPESTVTAQCHQGLEFKGATGYHVGQAGYLNQFPQNIPQPMVSQPQWNVLDQFAAFSRMYQYFNAVVPIMILPVQAPFIGRGFCPGGAHSVAKQIYVVEQGTQTDAVPWTSHGQDNSPKKEEKKTTPASYTPVAKGTRNQNVEQPVAVHQSTVVTTVSGTTKVSTVTQTSTASSDKGKQAEPQQSSVKKVMNNPVLIQLEENWKEAPRFTLIRGVDPKQQPGARRLRTSEEVATVVQGPQATKPVEPKKSAIKKPAPATPHPRPGPKSRVGQKRVRFTDQDEPTNERPKRPCKAHNNFERTCKLCNDEPS